MKKIGLIFLLLTLFGCSSESAEDAREETVGAEIADDYNRQMQRAREVETQLELQKRDLDAAIEKSDQPQTP